MKTVKNSFIGSTLGQKCPRCRQGDLFVHHPYNLKKFTEMNNACDVCGQKFTFEPGFYDGAMYVSYAMQVATITSVMVAYYVLYPAASLTLKLSTFILLMIAMIPLTLRVSRSLWIHFFVKFEPERSPK